MEGLELTTLITAIANFISCNTTIDELDLLSSIYTQLGDTLATISTQRSICEKFKDK